MMTKYFRLPYYFSLALLIYMPFHIFLSQWLSTFTGGLDEWKAAKDIFLFLAVTISVLLVYLKNGFSDKFFWTLTGLSVLYVAVHLLIWAINPDIAKGPALLGTVYNGRLFGYLLVGFSTAILMKDELDFRKFFKIALILSTLVCLLGLAQYYLPKDIMTHFGYSIDRGVKPDFAIDNKPDLPRVFSTLRDPNSLGAYLILPITLLSLAWIKKRSARVLVSGLLILHVLVLFLTFSRSALIGAFVSVILVLFWQYNAKTQKFIRKYWLIILGAFLVLAIGIFIARDQYVIQNVVFHSDENTKQTDSNNLHLDFARDGVIAIAKNPLGHGPGTAGLVSIQSNHVVLTENYFIQIGYEVGVFGLALLIYLMYLIVNRLYKRKDAYSKAMIASFFGLTICAMLLHTWSNEAVACQWWLLLGLLLYDYRANRRLRMKKE